MSAPGHGLDLAVYVVEGEIVEEYNPSPVCGDEIASRMLRTLEELPEGTILQSASEDAWDALAYRCTTFQWTVTGSADSMTSEKLHQFAASWVVVRWGAR